MTSRVVFDCMVFVQALARPRGPAGRCLKLAAAGDCELMVSDAIVAEIRDVASRPDLRRSFIRATDEDVEAFLQHVAAISTAMHSVPETFALARDPKDSMYLNLAIAAGAELVVSRDNDLLDLMTGTDADATTFRTTYPTIRVLDPVEFLRTCPPATDSSDEAP